MHVSREEFERLQSRVEVLEENGRRHARVAASSSSPAPQTNASVFATVTQVMGGWIGAGRGWPGRNDEVSALADAVTIGGLGFGWGALSVAEALRLVGASTLAWALTCAADVAVARTFAEIVSALLASVDAPGNHAAVATSAMLTLLVLMTHEAFSASTLVLVLVLNAALASDMLLETVSPQTVMGVALAQRMMLPLWERKRASALLHGSRMQKFLLVLVRVHAVMLGAAILLGPTGKARELLRELREARGRAASDRRAWNAVQGMVAASGASGAQGSDAVTT